MTINYIDNASNRIVKTNSYDNFKGIEITINITTDNIDKACSIENEIISTLADAQIWWSDDRCIHYSMDTKLSNGYWLESIYYNNELDTIDCGIYF